MNNEEQINQLLKQWATLDQVIKDNYANDKILKKQRHAVIAKCRRMLEKQVNKKDE